MGRVAVALGGLRSRGRTPTVAAACHAPFGNLFLSTLGDVRTCCISSGYPLGNIAEERLPDIWHGARQAALRQAMVDGDFSLGCRLCDISIAGDLPGVHHTYDGLATTTMTPAYPRRLEINISNACNLQCTMCSGEYSSSIRIHREHLPALPKLYGEQFFADLAEFIPHLDEVSFTGGEPFLAPEYVRIWELLAELNPEVKVQVTTNGTQWDDRVERSLGLLRFNVNVSIDGASKETYEGIRLGADWDVVRANLDRFADYTRRSGTALMIFHCLMPQNYDEFADVLLLGDELDADVCVHTVVYPFEHSLERVVDWGAVRRSFQRQADEVLPRLGRNAPAFDVQYRRVMDGGLREPEEPLLGLPRMGQPDFDEADVARMLGAEGSEASPLFAAIGDDQRLLEVSPALASFVQVAPEHLVGQPLDVLDEAMCATFGERDLGDVSAGTDDFYCRDMGYGDTVLRTVTMAARDATGWRNEVRLYVEPVS